MAKRPRSVLSAAENRKPRLDKAAQEVWKKFTKDVVKAVKEAEENHPTLSMRKKAKISGEILNGSCPQYEKPKSVLKREVYIFVLKYGNRHDWKKLSLVIAWDPKGQRSLQPTDNKFHDVLSRLENYDVGLDRSEVHRFSPQLEYARRHKIPPALLIGFILQTGNAKEIKNKVDFDNVTENWFNIEELSEFKSEEVSYL